MSKKIFLAFILALFFNNLSYSQTEEITPSNNLPTLKLGRNGGHPTIKGIDSGGGGNLVIDPASSGNAVFIGHYVLSNTYLSTGGGSVGIGTNSIRSGYKMEIAGKLVTSDGLDNGQISFRNDRDDSRIFESNHILNMVSAQGLTFDFDENNNNGGVFDIQDGNISRLMINQEGKVGIGTTDFSGNHKLRVEGSIGAREIKVEANGWSDFVFESDYYLRTLEEVEEHINKKGYLPEIPSEAEVTENGINLGEMNAKLLQKIEELTLYMININKRMNQLETENSELKEKVQLLENQ